MSINEAVEFRYEKDKQSFLERATVTQDKLEEYIKARFTREPKPIKLELAIKLRDGLFLMTIVFFLPMTYDILTPPIIYQMSLWLCYLAGIFLFLWGYLTFTIEAEQRRRNK